MAAEEDASAKTEEQDRLKALDTRIVDLGKARGGKDVPIDEVPRQKRQRQQLKEKMQSRKSTKALLRTASAAREKVIKLEGLQEEKVDLKRCR